MTPKQANQKVSTPPTPNPPRLAPHSPRLSPRWLCFSLLSGYGFAEYLDAHTAQSAIRNLNNYDLNGRSLRVDLADDDKSGGGGGQRRAPAAAPLSNASTTAASRFTLGSQQPTEQPTALPFTPATVLSLLSTLSQSQRVDLLLEMKRLSASNPEACRLLLMENPALAHLLLQCQLQFGLVKPEEIDTLVRGGTASPEPAQSAQPPPVPQPAAPSMSLPPLPPPQPQPLPPAMPGYGASPPAAYYPQPVASMPLPPPPAAAYPSADDILSRLPPLPPQQREILMELLRLTPDELRGLPMEAQQQVKDILQKMGIGR